MGQRRLRASRGFPATRFHVGTSERVLRCGCDVGSYMAGEKSDMCKMAVVVGSDERKRRGGGWSRVRTGSLKR